MAQGLKTGGRRKGTPNKATSEIKAARKAIIFARTGGAGTKRPRRSTGTQGFAQPCHNIGPVPANCSWLNILRFGPYAQMEPVPSRGNGHRRLSIRGPKAGGQRDPPRCAGTTNTASERDKQSYRGPLSASGAKNDLAASRENPSKSALMIISG